MLHLQKSISLFITTIIIWSLFPILPSFANIADHLVISEVVYGNANADDEYIEIYNPSNQAIDLLSLGLKLHIRNSTGATDTNKSIEWKQTSIPAYGFFLFASKTSVSYAALADANYSAGLVSHGAVYISLSSDKLSNVLDFIAWGNHSMPIGFETQKTDDFPTKKAIERKSNISSIDPNRGNAWDTDSNDFLVQDTPSPQNIHSTPEKYTLIIPDIPKNLQAQNISENTFDVIWENSSNISDIEITLNGSTKILSPAPTSYHVASLSPDTDYTLNIRSISTDQISSEIISITIHTLPLPQIIPEMPIENNPSEPEASDPQEEPETPTPTETPQEVIPPIPEIPPSENTPIIPEIPSQPENPSPEELVPEDPQVVPNPEEPVSAPENPDKEIPPENIQETAQITLLPIISEIYPEPHRNEPEWIELFNPNESIFPASGTFLCEGPNCISITVDIPPRSFLTLTKSDLSNFSGSWPDFSNTSGTVLWKKADGTLIDQANYQNSILAISFVRQADNSFLRTTHITKNIANSINTAPHPIIEIQGSGKSTGTARFSLNVSGESSYDDEKDSLQFLWDFGNGMASAKENPEGIYYELPGDYILTLILSDGMGEISRATKNITVLPPASGSSSSTTAKTTSQQQTLLTAMLIPPIQQEHHILFSKISMNDTEKDWIEMLCTDCQTPMSLSGFQLYDDKSFFSFPENISISSEPLRLIISKTAPERRSNNEVFIEKKSGLTKTDEQLILAHSSGYVLDALCWNNFDDTLSKKEAEEEESLRTSKTWNGICVDSNVSTKKGFILSRISSGDTNSKEDWEWILPEKKVEIIPEEIPTNLDGIRVSEIFINPKGKDKGNEWIELENCLDVPINTGGWTLHIGKKIIKIPVQDIEAKNFFIFKNTDVSFTLKNSLENIELMNPLQEQKDQIRYGKSKENYALARNENNSFSWTKIPTPEKNNVIWFDQGGSDTDADGIPDEVELALGTNPESRDSDNDKIPDGFELEYSLNPLTNNDPSLFQKYLEQKTKASIHIPRKSGNIFSISGQTEAFAFVTLAIHSKLHTANIQADSEGKWKYTIPQLEKGLHHIDIEIADLSGIHVLQSQIFQFELPYDYSAKKISSKKTQKKHKLQPAFISPKKYESRARAIAVEKNIYLQKKKDTQETSVSFLPLKETMGFGIGSFLIASMGYAFFLLKKQKNMIESK